MLRAAVLCMLLLAPPAMAAESLPMPVLRYAELCQVSGGTLTTHLTSGVGIVRCGACEEGLIRQPAGPAQGRHDDRTKVPATAAGPLVDPVK